MSSVENAGYPGTNAVDGNTGTRWSSAFSDPQWIYVDLQATYGITEVKLNWENAYATGFQIQVSSNAVDWTTIYTTTTGTGGIQDLTGLSGTGRYVRMYGTARKTQYGYSLWEFEVYGNLAVPDGLTATAGNQQVSLSWNTVPGATSYKVKCSTTNGGPYLTIASPTTTGYTNTALINGTTYYYVVSQVNAVAESTNSTQVSATPACSAPPAPTAANNGPLCAGSTLNLTASTVPGASLQLDGAQWIHFQCPEPLDCKRDGQCLGQLQRNGYGQWLHFSGRHYGRRRERHPRGSNGGQQWPGLRWFDPQPHRFDGAGSRLQLDGAQWVHFQFPEPFDPECNDECVRHLQRHGHPQRLHFGSRCYRCYRECNPSGSDRRQQRPDQRRSRP